ncbi:protein dispatched homolog 3-like [Oculina patagonica]
MQAGHSRKESDDFSKLCFGDDSENFRLADDSLMVDPALTEPSLSFHQPKSSFTSFRAFFSRSSTGIRAVVQRIPYRSRNNDLMKLYVHPVTSLVILIVAIAVPVLLGYYVLHNDYKERSEVLVIDKSLESFEIPGHISSQREDMISVASKLSNEVKGIPTTRSKRSASKPTKKKTGPHYQKSAAWTLELVYLAIGDDDLNIFTKERLESIHQIELSLMNQEGFTDYCWKWEVAKIDPFLKEGCTPPISLVDFFFPSVTPKVRIYDGQGMSYGGARQLNLTEESIKQGLQLLLTKPFTYWFVDGSFSKDNQKSRFLRAEVKFGYPLKSGGSRSAQNKKFKNYLVKYVEGLKKLSTNKVRLLYGGSTVFDYEVNKTLWADIGLTFYTIAFVGAFVLIFTRFSLYLTLFGIISILTPLCLAYYLFRIVFQIKSLGILSGISFFIIIGIGVDDVFVFINTFRQAHSARSLEARMAHTICTAGKATFFTSFTTCAAFAANCLSQMPAIHDFGLFMALIVGSCWLTVFCTIPPALNLWQRYIAKWEARFLGAISCVFTSGGSGLPDDIVQFLSGNDRNHTQHQSSTSSSSEVLELSTRRPVQDDDDSLLVQLDSSPPTSQNPSPSSSDSDLAMYDDPNGTFDQGVPLMRNRSLHARPAVFQQGQHNKGCHLSCGLQSFMYHWLGVPIQKFRFVVLAVFLLVLVGSIALDVQIQPSTKPPAFFKESTNLQQLLDLKYNMSSDKLNLKNVAPELIGNSIQSNFIDGPTTHTTPTTKAKESNGLKTSTSSSTPSPATAEQSGSHQKTNILQPGKTPKATPPTTTKTTTKKNKNTHFPTRPAKKTSTLKPKTKSTKKPTKPATQKPNQPKTEKPAPATPKPQNRYELQSDCSSLLTCYFLWSMPGGSENVVDPTVLPNATLIPPPCPEPCNAIAKPIVDSSSTVYVIFGLEKIDRSGITREHVIEEKGDVVPDKEFTKLLLKSWTTFLKYSCRLCKALSENKDLVQVGGADCFPAWILDSYINVEQNRHDDWNKDCLQIPAPTFSMGGKSRAKLMKMPSKDKSLGNYTYWMKMAFESTVFMGKSSEEKVEDFEKWDAFIKEQLSTGSFPKGFQTAFQSSSEWVMTFMEVIAINSAIYGIAFSLLLCLGSVAIFTANFLLTLIVMITILGVLTSVVAIFYLASWQLGAVEAISLSILVGTSVDYCVHLVEGYIMAGKSIPNLNSSKEIRGWRTLAAVSHIGTAILSSAITTIVASIPLCLTVIQLFAKFGQILAINTAVSIFFTLSICIALLCIMGPVRFKASYKSSAIALVIVVAVYSLGGIILYAISTKVVTIPGPAGKPLFS